MLSSPGQSFIIALYIEPLMEAASLSRVQLSSLYAAMTLGAAVTLPALGSLADRARGGWFLAMVTGALGMAMVVLAQAHTLWIVGGGLFLLRALGQGAIGLGVNVLTARWFQRLRGRTLAMVSLGYAAGELVFPALVLVLIGALSWRSSLWVLGLVYLLAAAPLFAMLLRERRPDEPWDGGGAVGEERHAALDTAYPWTLAQALRTPSFWMLVACVAVMPLVATAVIFHMVALFTLKGWAAESIPLAFALFAVTSTVSIQVTGLQLERTPSRFAIAAGMGLAVVALLTVLVPGPAWMAYVYLGLLGLSAGMMAASNAIVWPQYFGTHAHGAVRGVVTAFRNGSTAGGPLLFAMLLGANEDRLGTAIVALVVLCAVVALVAPFVRPPSPPP